MRHFFSFIIALLFVLPSCKTRDKITYDIPANYPEERRKDLIATCDKGKELYKDHCSECHGVFGKGKPNIPNFSTTQIDNYSARFMRRDPRNHAVMQNMSPQQLNEVLTFLKFKKRPAGADSVSNNPRMRRRL